MLSKSKNIVKTMEGCFKSPFSYIRNEVEKVTLGPSFWRGFLNQNPANIKINNKFGSLKNLKNTFMLALFFNKL